MVLAVTTNAFHALVAILVAVTFRIVQALAIITAMLGGAVLVFEAHVVVDAFAVFTKVLIRTFIIIQAAFVVNTATILTNEIHGTILIAAAITIIRSALFVDTFVAPALFITAARGSTFAFLITPIHRFVTISITRAVDILLTEVAITQASTDWLLFVDFGNVPCVTKGRVRQEENAKIGADIHFKLFFCRVVHVV